MDDPNERADNVIAHYRNLLPNRGLSVLMTVRQMVEDIAGYLKYLGFKTKDIDFHIKQATQVLTNDELN